MSIEAVQIELTSRQVDLLLEYGCPFEGEQKQLKILQKCQDDFHILKTDDFYAPLLLSDVADSIKNMADGPLLDELIEIAESIESAMSMNNKSQFRLR